MKMTPQEFKKKWGYMGVTLIINKVCDEYVLSEQMRDKLREISKDLKEMLRDI
jgi:hypothetical protein